MFHVGPFTVVGGKGDGELTWEVVEADLRRTKSADHDQDQDHAHALRFANADVAMLTP